MIDSNARKRWRDLLVRFKNREIDNAVFCDDLEKVYDDSAGDDAIQIMEIFLFNFEPAMGRKFHFGPKDDAEVEKDPKGWADTYAMFDRSILFMDSELEFCWKDPQWEWWRKFKYRVARLFGSQAEWVPLEEFNLDLSDDDYYPFVSEAQYTTELERQNEAKS